MTNRGLFPGLSRVMGWTDITPNLVAFAATGTPTQPVLVNPTSAGRYIVNPSGKVHYNGFITFGSSDSFGSSDHYWGVQLPVPANRSSNAADLPIGTAWGWQNSVSNRNLVLTPTLADPQTPYLFSQEDYFAQFFLSAMIASGTGTFGSGATSVTVTHGLGTTPTAKDITITPTNVATSGPRVLYVDTLTSTQFNVNVGTSSAGTTQQFSWAAQCWPNASSTLDLLVNHARPWLWASGMTLGWSLVYEARR